MLSLFQWRRIPYYDEIVVRRSEFRLCSHVHSVASLFAVTTLPVCSAWLCLCFGEKGVGGQEKCVYSLHLSVMGTFFSENYVVIFVQQGRRFTHCHY